MPDSHFSSSNDQENKGMGRRRGSHLSMAFDEDNKEKSFRGRGGLTFSRDWLIQVANRTLQIASDGRYLNKQGKIVDIAEDFQYSLNNSAHYHSSHVFTPSETTRPRFQTTKYQVCYGSSLQVATKLQEELQEVSNIIDNDETIDIDIGILNSASAKNPAKFLRGTLSQEEGLCRSSFLYPCLAQYKDRPHYFYYVNHKRKYQESSSSCAIYCPKVPVIREDSMTGDLLDTPLKFSMVSIPAPNAFELGRAVPKAQLPGAMERNEAYEDMTIDSAMHDRLFRALSIFAEQGCTDLVLCAFGCGVHGNSPQKIATCIQDILSNEFKGRFRTVHVAIQPSRHSSFETFASVFQKKSPEVLYGVEDTPEVPYGVEDTPEVLYGVEDTTALTKLPNVCFSSTFSMGIPFRNKTSMRIIQNDKVPKSFSPFPIYLQDGKPPVALEEQFISLWNTTTTTTTKQMMKSFSPLLHGVEDTPALTKLANVCYSSTFLMGLPFRNKTSMRTTQNDKVQKSFSPFPVYQQDGKLPVADTIYMGRRRSTGDFSLMRRGFGSKSMMPKLDKVKSIRSIYDEVDESTVESLSMAESEPVDGEEDLKDETPQKAAHPWPLHATTTTAMTPEDEEFGGVFV
jgi:uncharacterized protein (TIGR02452 family)